jgi:hypothetical protein
VTGEITVFLGPTLPHLSAREILDAIYLPPAEQGSVVRAVRTHKPRAIVLIDGVFGSAPAVRHKEILWALARGVPVFGAASIGALRAAELSDSGMRGHGFIHRWYALTPLADDDEVAVAMTPAELGAQALSEALINIRLTLRLAQRRGLVAEPNRRILEELARSMHFLDRSYPRLLDDARTTLPAGTLSRLERWLPAGAIDQKREDAMGLLGRLAREPALLEPLARTSFHLTEAWAYDLDAAGLWDDDIASAEKPS